MRKVFYFHIMKKPGFFIFAMLLAIGVYAQPPVKCLIRTSMGDITIELYPDRAPLTVANFLKYVDTHLYDGTHFFRTVRMDNQPDNAIKIEVIQGGDVPPGRELPAVIHESTMKTGILHRDGTVSMARKEIGTATCNFFICIHDQPQLDYGGRRNPDGQGFAAFGKVISGMETVRRIHQLPADGQILFQPVMIITVNRIP